MQIEGISHRQKGAIRAMVNANRDRIRATGWPCDTITEWDLDMEYLGIAL